MPLSLNKLQNLFCIKLLWELNVKMYTKFLAQYLCKLGTW